MDKIKQLKAAHAAKVAEMEAVINAAETDGGRDFTAEEQTAFDAFKAEADILAQKVTNQEAIVKVQAEAARHAAVNAPVLDRQIKDAGVVTDDPLQKKAGAASAKAALPIVIPARAARYAGTLKAFTGTNAMEEAYKCGMWYVAAIFKNENAAKWCAEHGMELTNAAIGQSESINTDGGYTVPDILESRIIRLVEGFGLFRQMAFNWPMTSEVHKIPRRIGGLTGYHVGEAEAATASKVTFDLVQLVAKKVTAMAVMTNEVNADNIIRMSDLITVEIALAIATREDQDGFNGDGTSTYGGIVGIRPALVNINGVDEGGGLILGTGNLWSELTLGDFNRVKGRTPNYEGPQNEEWVCSKPFKSEVMDNIKYAGGGNTVKDLADGTGEEFLGFRIRISNAYPKTQANSQVACTFGDMNLSSTFGDRAGMSLSMSKEATVGGVNLWETDQMGIKGITRYDINNHDLGDATNAGAVVGLITAAS